MYKLLKTNSKIEEKLNEKFRTAGVVTSFKEMLDNREFSNKRVLKDARTGRNVYSLTYTASDITSLECGQLLYKVVSFR